MSSSNIIALQGGTLTARGLKLFGRAATVIVVFALAAHAAETQKSQAAIGGEESHEALRARIISPVEDKYGELICQVEILEGRRSGETLEARCPRKYAEVLRPGDAFKFQLSLAHGPRAPLRKQEMVRSCSRRSRQGTRAAAS